MWTFEHFFEESFRILPSTTDSGSRIENTPNRAKKAKHMKKRQMKIREKRYRHKIMKEIQRFRHKQQKYIGKGHHSR